jgi:NADPH:quinone reductase-like Zn-dependent oxidoreductase
VLGAAGSVGAYAVQFARQAGAHVIAAAAEKDFGFVQALGAEQVFDPRRAPSFDPDSIADAVIDLVGGEVQRAAVAWLRPGGTLISAVSQPDTAHAPGIEAAFFLVDVTTGRLERIAALLASGALKTSVGAVLPLASVRTSHEMLEGTRPRPRGKIVLRRGVKPMAATG